MSTKYKATTTDQAYFITRITTVGWVDVFYATQPKVQYVKRKKGLEIYAYCIMHSHIHLMCKTTNGFILSDVMRDFKKFTSKKIIQTIMGTRESQGSFLAYFEKACAHLKEIKVIKYGRRDITLK
jgi:REP element-mobilizing transposase RayT